MRRTDLRWLVVLAANLLLGWLVGAANHHLASAWFPFSDFFSVHLYLRGLFLTFAALRLDARNGFIAIILTGLFCDALEPVPFGTSATLLGLAYAALLQARHRFPRDEALFSTIVALLTNLGLFIVMSFVFVGASPRPGETWLRLFSDLVFSQLALVAITPWFLAFQTRVFELMAVHPETGRHVEPADV